MPSVINARPDRHQRPCTHCGTAVRTSTVTNFNSGEPIFCCLGCNTVYSILTAGGLKKYYDLRKESSDFAPPRPVEISSETYKYLDDPEFKQKFARDGASTMDFYLEGVHCAACLWLVDKLPDLVPAVENASLDIGRSIARVKVKANCSFASAAKTLEALGYKPHPIERNEQAEVLQKKENRSWLIRIGVAGGCAGNIMLLAIPLYSGAEGQFSLWFRWLSLLLFLPVIFYSAVPFYKSAWASIRSRSISVDLPVVIAIIFGSAASAAHLSTGSDHIYFDSLSALVFLLLSSRFVLRRLQQGALQSSHLFQFLAPSFARRIDSNSHETTEVAVTALRIGDHIKVEPAEVFPADGIVFNGSGSVNCSLLTGESTPRPVSAGDSVFSGTVNEEGSLQVEITALGAQTKLGQILKQIEHGSLKKAKIVTAADKIAKWFLTTVFISAICVLFLSPSLSEGFSRALALVIVTCPCALALATPLAMSVALTRAAKAGILIKGAETLEKVNQAKNVVLDKTGTLTHGNLEVLSFLYDPELQTLREAVVALEEKSKHPIAKAIVSFLRPQLTMPIPKVENHKERIGHGIVGTVLGRSFGIHPLRDTQYTSAGIYCDGILVGQAQFGDRLRENSAKCVTSLQKFGLETFILSGDNKHTVEATALKVGIPVAQAIACFDPESKQSFIEAHPKSLMVGDGANDALALSAAFVGIAVHGSMEVSLRAADVYLTRPGLAPVVELVQISRETMRTIHRNFLFSLIYNLSGGIAAATGMVTPLFAALLMPLSAFTVFGSSLIGSRRPRL